MAVRIHGVLLPELVRDLRFGLTTAAAGIGQDDQAADTEKDVADVFHDEVHLLLQEFVVQ
jgi:hypothetical protein